MIVRHSLFSKKDAMKVNYIGLYNNKVNHKDLEQHDSKLLF